MIKNYTEPQNKAIWAKYKPLIRILLICSILASIYSGITEFYKFYSTFSIPSPEARFTAALALTLLIELALRGFSKMLFEAIFEPAEQDEEEEKKGNEIVREKARPIMIGFLIVAVIAVGYVSTSNSLDGKSTYIDDTYQPPVEQKAKDQAAKIKAQKARNQFEADSLKVLAEVRQKIKEERTSLQTKQNKANKDINWLKSEGRGDWENIKVHVSRREKAKASIIGLATKEKEEIELALLPVRATYQDSLKVASSVMENAVSAAIAANDKAYQDFLDHKLNQQESYSFLVYLAIIFIVLHNFFKYYAYKASGRKPVYIVNPIGHSISPLAKLKEGLKAKFWNGINSLVNRWIGDEIEVSENKLEIKVKTEPKTDEEEEVLDNDELDELEVPEKSEQPNVQKSKKLNNKTDEELYGRPKAEQKSEQKAEQQPRNVQKSKTEQDAQPSEHQIDIILSSKFLQNVRNHYWAANGLNKRGSKEATRKRNKAKFEQEKKILESIGVKVIEGKTDVKFDITAVKKVKN
jgi:hypothetical protein